MFAKTPSDDLASLVKKIDEFVAANKNNKVAAVLNFTGDPDDSYRQKIEQLAKKNGIENIALTTTGDAARFRVSEEAELTIMHYKGKTVLYNFSSESAPSPDEVKQILQGAQKLVQ